ncbi:non-ribosomal peptide synthetase [Deinococcus cellulosilyticus]|uniref:Uncharacterized protein n=1 Tax=Deinococcus cellulosilyticus (strain DSM 18568 / NBRC 106333 / KACC 11606 / 5516J-15) TaxID=1223518 RepID=A0A511MZX6_DEIC1|nr:non-ribosomal peptide synthetase [Deinococcus cellulosilyticus]GEM46143.1 hypothetical protein DC3_17780 [Deinococcus cellulosilyticus NBRC 106333 = KACC 11606]
MSVQSNPSTIDIQQSAFYIQHHLTIAGFRRQLQGLPAGALVQVQAHKSHQLVCLLLALYDCRLPFVLSDPEAFSVPSVVHSVIRLQDEHIGIEHNPQHNGFLEADLMYLVRTSGSTGQPKHVLVSRTAYTSLLNKLQRFLVQQGIQIEQQVSCVNVAFGYFMFDLALQILCAPRTLFLDTPAALPEAWDHLKSGNWHLSITPSTLLDHPFHQLEGCRLWLSGEPIGPAVAHCIETRQLLRHHRMWVSFATTETGGQISLGELQAGQELVGACGTLLPGVTLELHEDHTMVRTDSLFSGYLLPDGQVQVPAGGFICPDVLTFQQNQLYFLGRNDGTQKRHGLFTNHDQREQGLLRGLEQYPMFAHRRTIADATYLVAVALVPAEEQAGVYRWIQQQPHLQPDALFLVEGLFRNNNHKAVDPISHFQNQAPLSLQAFLQVACACLLVPDMDPSQGLLDVGADSLRVLILARLLSDVYGKPIDFLTLVEHPTFKDLHHHLSHSSF